MQLPKGRSVGYSGGYDHQYPFQQESSALDLRSRLDGIRRCTCFEASIPSVREAEIPRGKHQVEEPGNT